MASNSDDETVADILKRKKASVRQAALEPGSPSWDEVLDLTWAEIKERARRRLPGYKTFRKLLSDSEYNR
jgi:hypothetical protein